MRPVLVSLVAVALGLTVTGCRAEDTPARSVVAVQLAALCTSAREDVEALGLPAETGIAVVKPWAARGRRLARDIGALDGGTPSEQEQVEKLGRQLDAYYRGLGIAYDVYQQTKSSESYRVAADRATASLEVAESLARGLGVSECAERPFADYEPS